MNFVVCGKGRGGVAVRTEQLRVVDFCWLCFMFLFWLRDSLDNLVRYSLKLF